MSFLFKKYLFSSMILGVLVSPLEPTQATETSPIISKILSTAAHDGFPKAIQILNKEFEKNKDIKLELLIIKAQLYFKSQRHNEAIAIYQNLIKDHPENILLYNNLATIYADQGDLEAAEETLLNGIKQQSNFDTAYHNLMKLKGKQAAIALQSALNPTISNPKNLQLTAINQIANGINLAVPQKITDEKNAGAYILPEKSKVDAFNTAEFKTPTASDMTKVENISIQNPKQTIISPNQSKETVEHALEVQTIKAAHQERKDEIPELLNAWAREWSKGNAEVYLSFYSATFKPEGQIDLEDWRNQRRQRINPNQQINVQLENIETKINNSNLIQASFKQIYTSRTIKARANKRITFEKQKDQWKIIREEVIK